MKTKKELKKKWDKGVKEALKGKSFDNAKDLLVDILGVKFKTTGKILEAPNNEAVSEYLKAVKEGSE